MKKIIGPIIILITISTNYSCKKFLAIDPPKDKILSSQIFENDETATSAMTGIYSRMATSGFASGDLGSTTILSGLSSDDLISYSASLNFFYQNDVPTSDGRIENLWSNLYNYIYSSNVIIEELPMSNGVTNSIRAQLMGEAKFIRAFCYFYIVNLFGDAPLILTTDYRLNDQSPRSSKDKIYAQIIDDLKIAENLLSPNYVSSERVRPNKWAAVSLLSRVYLYTENWSEATNKATEVIDQKTTFQLVTDYDQIFLRASKEAIWQLIPPAGRNTLEGGIFILNSTPNTLALSPGVVNAFDDPKDNRKSKWIKQFSNTSGVFNYPFKYKIKTASSTTLPVTEYSMVIRLAEIYLIRAEARIRNNNIIAGIADLNLVRRRPLENGTPSNLITALPSDLNQSDALSAVEKERKIELFAEWGHRWFDLKRTSRASSVLSPIKGSNWKDTDVLYPIPNSEINRNKSISQNLGY